MTTQKPELTRTLTVHVHEPHELPIVSLLRSLYTQMYLSRADKTNITSTINEVKHGVSRNVFDRINRLLHKACIVKLASTHDGLLEDLIEAGVRTTTEDRLLATFSYAMDYVAVHERIVLGVDTFVRRGDCWFEQPTDVRYTRRQMAIRLSIWYANNKRPVVKVNQDRIYRHLLSSSYVTADGLCVRYRDLEFRQLPYEKHWRDSQHNEMTIEQIVGRIARMIQSGVIREHRCAV